MKYYHSGWVLKLGQTNHHEWKIFVICWSLIRLIIIANLNLSKFHYKPNHFVVNFISLIQINILKIKTSIFQKSGAVSLVRFLHIDFLPIFNISSQLSVEITLLFLFQTGHDLGSIFLFPLTLQNIWGISKGK